MSRLRNLLKRIRTLWRLSALDLGVVDAAVAKQETKTTPASIIEMRNPLDLL